MGHVRRMPRPPQILTCRQELFILEYAKDLNATQAAIRAGYSAKTASAQASRLLKKVMPLVKRHQAATRVPDEIVRHQRGIATLEQTLRLCTAMAFGDPRAIFDAHNNCKSVNELTRRQALMITGFEVEETFTQVGDRAAHTGYVKRFRLADRAPYVNMLLKHLGAFPAKQILVAPTSASPRFDTSNWTTEDWEIFKKLREKSNIRAMNV